MWVCACVWAKFYDYRKRKIVKLQCGWKNDQTIKYKIVISFFPLISCCTHDCYNNVNIFFFFQTNENNRFGCFFVIVFFEKIRHLHRVVFNEKWKTIKNEKNDVVLTQRRYRRIVHKRILDIFQRQCHDFGEIHLRYVYIYI